MEDSKILRLSIAKARKIDDMHAAYPPVWNEDGSVTPARNMDKKREEPNLRRVGWSPAPNGRSFAKIEVYKGRDMESLLRHVQTVKGLTEDDALRIKFGELKPVVKVAPVKDIDSSAEWPKFFQTRAPDSNLLVMCLAAGTRGYCFYGRGHYQQHRRGTVIVADWGCNATYPTSGYPEIDRCTALAWLKKQKFEAEFDKLITR